MGESGKKAMIAMSGGVDSSVAALLMLRDGFDCTGVTMRLYREPGFAAACAKSCCSDEDEEDAAFVCQQMGIPHESACFSRLFEQRVIRKFIREYESGRTPNPCIDCNRYLKFDRLVKYADEQGMEYVVTGHYARIEYDREKERYLLKKALDRSKDQSYVLYMLTQEQLERIRFPLGGLRKSEVREIAERQGFCNARKHDSQDICFVPDGDHGRFLARFRGRELPEGKVLNERGEVVGTHKGAAQYTVGQRKGLGIGFGERTFVQAIVPLRKEVVLGTRDDLARSVIRAADANWIAPVPIGVPFRVQVKIRYRSAAAEATVTAGADGTVTARLDEPRFGVAPGQSLVCYWKDRLIGGGIIAENRE